jgi:hypothetical protein
MTVARMPAHQPMIARLVEAMDFLQQFLTSCVRYHQTIEIDKPLLAAEPGVVFIKL